MSSVFVSIFLEHGFGAIGFVSKNSADSFFGIFFTQEQGHEFLRRVDMGLISVEELQVFADSIDEISADSLSEPLLFTGNLGHLFAVVMYQQEEIAVSDSYFTLTNITVGDTSVVATAYEVDDSIEVAFAFAIDQLYILLSNSYLEENLTYKLSDPSLVGFLPAHNHAHPIQKIRGDAAVFMLTVLSLSSDQEFNSLHNEEMFSVN